MAPRRRLRQVIVLGVVATFIAACSSGGAGPAETPASSSGVATGAPVGSRLSSPAVLTLVQPTEGEVVTGSMVHVVVALQNATIVPATTTNVQPTTGHVHLYVDNVLVSMNYGLTQDIAVKPGTWTMKAEFVAADHVPFDPRVYSNQVLFTVK